MIYNTSAGQDVHFSEKLLEMGRNFANKVWNATNFVLMNLEGFDPQKIEKSDLNFELVDRWIYSRLHTTIQQAIEKLETYTLDEAAKLIYEFIRGDFCDWYLEMAKVRLYGNTDQQSKNTAQWVLCDVLKQSLQLLHPFMPFITEELWQQL
jgi:valine--tRNA ligase